MSANSPYGEESLDFAGFANDAPAVYAPSHDFEGSIGASWQEEGFGHVHDELPQALETFSEDRHAAWSPPPGEPLRAPISASQFVYVVRLVRVMPPSPLRLTAPTGGVGSSLSGGFSEQPGSSGASRQSPIAAKAPPSGETSSFADTPLNVIASTVTNRSTSWLPAVTTQSQTASRGESPLLRALESRDAVFRALAATTGNHTAENSASLRHDGNANDESRDVDALDSPTDDSDAHEEELVWDDSFDSVALRDRTDQQAADVAAILDELAFDHADHRSRSERVAAAADLPLPTEPALPLADAATSAADQGGMILLGALARDVDPTAAGEEIALGALPHPAVGMQAEIGLYQAFGVAAGETVDDVPAAAALPVKSAPSQGGANEQNARESAAAPTASALPEAVVTASVVSLTVAASGLRTRSYPQIRRERR